MRKKVIILFGLLLIIITGCELNNNPTSKVEELLGKYQGLDKKIEYNYLDLIEDNSISDNFIKQYNDIIKKQYRNLSYEIKDEIIDGDSATVVVEIEVLDYKSVLGKYDLSVSSNTDTHQEIIDKLKKIKNKVTYTIEFEVQKVENDNWKIEELSLDEKQKLLGIY